MKINWNNKYLTISVYALLSLTVGILVYKFLNGFSGYTTIIDAVFDTVTPIVYGIVIAYLLSPIAKFFEYRFFPWLLRGKMSSKTYRYLGITSAYVLLGLVIVLVLYFAIPELIKSIDRIFASLPSYFEFVQDWLEDFVESSPGSVLARNIDLSSVTTEAFLGDFQIMVESSFNAVKSTLSAFVGMIVNLVLGIAISIYLLCDRETYFRQIRKVLCAFIDKKKVDRFYNSCSDAKEIFNSFMYGKLIECLIVGLVCYIGVLIMGVNNALLISVIIGVTNFIPYFGPVIGTVPCVVLIFFDAEGGATNPTMAIIFVIFILVLQQIDGNILGPKIQGKSVGISAFWVLISVVVFGEFFGVLGMLISVPIFAVMISVFRVFVNKRIEKKQLLQALSDGTTQIDE